MNSKGSETANALKQCQYLWEEYKYRHDLIWQRIFRFTMAIVLISIIPYIQQDIVRLLRNRILIAPFLAFLLASFIFLVIRNELQLFEKIKEAYRRQQNKLLDNDLRHKLNQKSDFKLFVMAYFGSLTLLAIVNGFIVWQVWVPKVLAQPICQCP